MNNKQVATLELLTLNITDGNESKAQELYNILEGHINQFLEENDL